MSTSMIVNKGPRWAKSVKVTCLRRDSGRKRATGTALRVRRIEWLGEREGAVDCGTVGGSGDIIRTPCCRPLGDS